MSLDYIRKTYGVPATRGRKVRFIAVDQTVKHGTITSATHLLYVTWDDGSKGILHPTWHVQYLDDSGAVIPRKAER